LSLIDTDVVVCEKSSPVFKAKYPEPGLIVVSVAPVNLQEAKLPSSPELPLVPDEPELPLVPEEPELPLVPDEPELPEVPDEPLVPDVPEVKPEVRAEYDICEEVPEVPPV